MRVALIAAMGLRCLMARGDDDFDKAFGKPTPTPAPQFEIVGRVVQKTGDGLYLVQVDLKCAIATHIVKLLYAEDGNSVYTEPMILLRGEPSVRDGDDIATYVLPDGVYDYETTTGRQAEVGAYRVAAIPSAAQKLSTADKVFGAGSGFGHTALDGPATRGGGN